MKKNILIGVLIIMNFGLSGCILRPHVPDVQQGNIIDQKEINQLKVGMSKNEVKELLGDPILTNIFDRRCFIYAYTNQINRNKISSKNLTVCFDAEGHLATIQNNQNN
jgi:outer membrane protein assembly factor BamE